VHIAEGAIDRAHCVKLTDPSRGPGHGSKATPNSGDPRGVFAARDHRDHDERQEEQSSEHHQRRYEGATSDAQIAAIRFAIAMIVRIGGLPSDLGKSVASAT
jgi:hypothetical protein